MGSEASLLSQDWIIFFCVSKTYLLKRRVMVTGWAESFLLLSSSLFASPFPALDFFLEAALRSILVSGFSPPVKKKHKQTRTYMTKELNYTLQRVRKKWTGNFTSEINQGKYEKMHLVHQESYISVSRSWTTLSYVTREVLRHSSHQQYPKSSAVSSIITPRPTHSHTHNLTHTSLNWTKVFKYWIQTKT